MENSKLSVMLNAQQANVVQGNPVQTITLNIVNTLPILSPEYSPGFTYINPGKSRSLSKHICTHCGRDCLKPSVLEKHIRSHTGERPFPCTTCNISFKTQSNLYKHRKTQTHVNNAKLSLQSDHGSCLNDEAGDQAPGTEQDIGVDTGQHTTPDTSISLQENSCPSVGTNDACAQVNSLQSDHGSGEKTTGEQPFTMDTISPTVPIQRKMLKDQFSPSVSRQFQLHRQYETCVEKQWERSPSKHKLKKCESTDSGYLSHSDSADLQMFSGSPLHSLSECSIESEHALGTSSLHAANEDGEDKMAAGKKTLEEHIAMLISRNQALVNDTHLDNVRPRKTTLSKQGSIDLPMPYTFKDSFHFDIKSFDPNRKKVTPCCIKSAPNPTEKNKPLFFHSVPTQFSTSLETMTMPRCNSLPLVETCRLTSDMQAYKTLSIAKQPLDISFAGLLLTNTASTCTVDFSSSHPRGLVRQTAVDEVSANLSTECQFPEEGRHKKRLTSDRSASKCKAASKRRGSKKTTMFSHEKWQMYGDETFKKLYQDIEKSRSSRKSKPENAEQKRLADEEMQIPNCDGNLTKGSTKALSPAHVGNTASVDVKQEPSPVKESQLPNSNPHKSSNATRGSRGSQSAITCDYPVQREAQAKTSDDKQTTSTTPSSKSEFPQPLIKGQSVCVNSGSFSIALKDAAWESSRNADKTSSQASCKDSCNNPENFHSERKKLKVSEIGEHSADGALGNSEFFGGEDTQGSIAECLLAQQLQANVNTGANDSGRTGFHNNKERDAQVLDGEVFGLPSPAKVTCNSQGSFGGLSKSGRSSQQTVGSPLSNKNAFSPRYIIKLQSGGPTTEQFAGLDAEQDQAFRMSFEETDVESMDSMHFKECSSSASVSMCHAEPIQAYPSVDTLRLLHTKAALNVHSQTALPVPSSSPTVCMTQDYDSKKLEEKQTTDTLNTAVQMASHDSSHSRGFLVISQDDCPEEISQKHTRDTLSDHLKISTPMIPGDKLRDKPGLGTIICHNESNGLVIGSSQECCVVANPLPAQPSRSQEANSAIESGRAMKPQVLNSGSNIAQASKVSFSALNTEPNPTWCWLNRSIPLPSEQKDKSFSVYATETCNTMENKGTGLGSQIRFPEARPVNSSNLARNISSLAWSSPRNKGTIREDARGVHSRRHAEEVRAKGMRFGHTQTSNKRSNRTKTRLRKRRSASSSKHMGPTFMQVKTSHETISDHQQQGACHKTAAKSFYKKMSAKQPGNLFGGTRNRGVRPGISTETRRPVQEDTSGAEKAGAGIEENRLSPLTTNMPPSAIQANGVPSSSDLDPPELLKESALNLQISVSPIDIKEMYLQEGSGDGSPDLLTLEIIQDHQKPGLPDSPPQKHGHRVLQRSKTIKSSSADQATPEYPLMPPGTTGSKSMLPAVDALRKALGSKLTLPMESATRQCPPRVTLFLEPMTKCTAPTLAACMGSLPRTTASIVTPCSESVPQMPLSTLTTCSTVSLVIPSTYSLPQPPVAIPKSFSDNTGRPTVSTLPPCLKPLVRTTAAISSQHITDPTKATMTQHSDLQAKPSAPVIMGCVEPIGGSTFPMVIPRIEPLKGNTGPMVVPCSETLARSALHLFSLCSETMPVGQTDPAVSETTSSPTETSATSRLEPLSANSVHIDADNSGAFMLSTESCTEPISRYQEVAFASCSATTASLHSVPWERPDAVNPSSSEKPLDILSQSTDSTSAECLGPLKPNISGSDQTLAPETQDQIRTTATPSQRHPLRFHTMTFTTQKRLSLEVMRKHTRVEYSDTSSDDEDRLVIEM
uniref:C2H2-type domain-containing protein n=1 Tax=Leptobrachium leishanense TaxID=445787 RepID=A0A8C5WEA3_9ANUR